jgi:hypothetical protein
MNGPGPAPPPQLRPPGGRVIALRVLLLVIGYAGFSLLNWILLLRLALLRRRPVDWVVFGAVGFVLPAAFLSMVSDSEDITGPVDATGTLGFAFLWLFAPVYFLIMDIQIQRHSHKPYATAYPYVPQQPPLHAQPPLQRQAQPQPQPPVQPPAYGYNPYRDTPTPPPTPAPAPPPPAVPQPPRINQVRAELDELSDLLRKQEGHQ